MPSAHYRPLEQSLQEIHDVDDDGNDDDTDGPDYEYSNHPHQHHQLLHTHPQLLPGGYYASRANGKPALNMAGRLMRHSAGTRSCLVVMIICICLIVYWTTVIGLGPGAGANDADTDYGQQVDTGRPQEQQAGAGVARLHQVRKTFGLRLNLKRSARLTCNWHMESRESTNMRILNETLHICSESNEDRRRYMQNKPLHAYALLPVIYFVTPTYPRREQIPELTRLAHTLLHVPRIHWLVANDLPKCNTFLDQLLLQFGIPYTHLSSPMPSRFRKNKLRPRGVANRRAALQWLRHKNITNGVLYFGDDDNTYDLKLFSEIRETQRVSMFPVGLIADYAVSGPVVRNGKVVGFLDSWVADRRWPVDMAGFAVNLAYMAQYPNVNMPYKPGFEEVLFLQSLGLRIDQIEPRGKNCTEILVWHTQTKKEQSPVVRINSGYLDERSNLGALFRALAAMGVARASNNEGVDAKISKNGKVKAHSYFLS